MPEWSKVLVLLVGLGGWTATVAVTLWQRKIPDLGTLAIPAALITALAPPIRIGRGRAESDETQTEGAETEAGSS